MQFTVSETVDGKRAIVSDVHSQLSFQNCVLWAENFKENGNLWSNTEWMAYSAKFKVDYETLIEEVDVLLSQAISSYFGTVWGLFVSFITRIRPCEVTLLIILYNFLAIW